MIKTSKSWQTYLQWCYCYIYSVPTCTHLWADIVYCFVCLARVAFLWGIDLAFFWPYWKSCHAFLPEPKQRVPHLYRRVHYNCIHHKKNSLLLNPHSWIRLARQSWPLYHSDRRLSSSTSCAGAHPDPGAGRAAYPCITRPSHDR